MTRFFADHAKAGCRRWFLCPLLHLSSTRAILSLAAALPQVLYATSVIADSDSPPNMVVILADDLGYSDLGCYGGEIDTPNIDALAKGGVRFTQFYNSARCCPSRASLMTGLYPSQAGIGDFTTGSPSPTRGPGYLGRLNGRCVTLAEVLGTAGYRCYYAGKWHMHEATGPIARGFDEFYGYTRGHSHDQYDADYYIRLPAERKKEIDPPADEYYATDVFNQYALEFIRQGQKSDRPWLVFLGHSSPHFPVQAPAERADKHQATYLRGWDVLREERYERMQRIGLIDGDHWKQTPRSIVPVDRDDIANGHSGRPNPAWDSLDEPRRRDLARRMAVFAAMVAAVDQGVGKIVEHLKATGDLDNTLILFLSDNGACYEWGPFGFDGTSRRGTTVLRTGDELRNTGGRGTHQSYGSAWANLGNTPLRLYKHFTHEGGISTPMIAHWPKGIGKPDKWIRQPSHVMDVMPTLAEAAGAEYPAEFDGRTITPIEGRSLLPLMRGKALPERTIGFDHQGARAIRQGDWKLVWSKRMPREIAWELYNLAEDRCETNDLAAKHPDRVRAMAADWERWARHVQVLYEAKQPEGQRTDAADDTSPLVAGKPIAVLAEVNVAAPKGVVLAQGGQEQGYALHFVDGKAAFDVRIDGKVTRLLADEPVRGNLRLEAALDREKMTLTINGECVAEIDSPGLIPVQPKDALSVGFDSLTAAGNYRVPNPFNGTVISTRVDCDGKPPAVATAMDRATIETGLKSHDRALYVKEGWIRDPYIVLAPDGYYYLTGTTPNPGDPREKSDPYNTGLGKASIVGWKMQLWRSRDLIDWQSLGTPFSLIDGYWAKKQPEAFAGADRSGWHLWAPEVHFLGGRWHVVHTTPGPVRRGSNLAVTEGAAIEGPYTFPLGALSGGRHDPSLFRDDDGTVYLLWSNTMIVPLTRDLSGFAAEPVRIDPAGSRPGPDGRAISRIGHEGATIRKIGERYVHFGTAWSTDRGRRGSYNLYYCTAEKITGPYGPRRFAGRFLGHGTPFQDKQGRWWCTAFFNANVPPLPRDRIETRDLSATAQTINQRGTTIVPLDVRVTNEGDVFVRAKDPAYATPGPDEAQKIDR